RAQAKREDWRSRLLGLSSPAHTPTRRCPHGLSKHKGNDRLGQSFLLGYEAPLDPLRRTEAVCGRLFCWNTSVGAAPFLAHHSTPLDLDTPLLAVGWGRRTAIRPKSRRRLGGVSPHGTVDASMADLPLILVINMQRDTTRWQTLSSALTAQGLPYTRVPGIDA